jgi:predicted RNase H-like nuclease (RuvC/YqgF family)
MPDNEFPALNEEVKRLTSEIEGLRQDLQAASRKLVQMEKRLRAVFPNLPKKRKLNRQESENPSTKTPEELQNDFQVLLRAVEESGHHGFESVINTLSRQDVIALAIELGVGQPKKSGVNKAIDGIRKRVQERIMLGHTRNSGL